MKNSHGFPVKRTILILTAALFFLLPSLVSAFDKACFLTGKNACYILTPGRPMDRCAAGESDQGRQCPQNGIMARCISSTITYFYYNGFEGGQAGARAHCAANGRGGRFQPN